MKCHEIWPFVGSAITVKLVPCRVSRQMLLWLWNNAAILIAVGVSILTGLFTLLFLVLFVFPLTHNKEKRIAVLVLGDVGRSPRMQNHAVSLAKAGCQVDLLGLKGINPLLKVCAEERC